jgi:hypothetical protein
MTRCKHGVFVPSKIKKSQPNPHCSICTQPIPLTDVEKEQYRMMKKRWRD